MSAMMICINELASRRVLPSLAPPKAQLENESVQKRPINKRGRTIGADPYPEIKTEAQNRGLATAPRASGAGDRWISERTDRT